MVCTKLWYLMKCRPHSLKIQTYGKKIYPTMGQLSIIGNSLQVASNIYIYIFIRILFSFLHQKEKQVIWFSKKFPLYLNERFVVQYMFPLTHNKNSNNTFHKIYTPTYILSKREKDIYCIHTFESNNVYIQYSSCKKKCIHTILLHDKFMINYLYINIDYNLIHTYFF
jgi:hypothetical protein